MDKLVAGFFFSQTFLLFLPRLFPAGRGAFFELPGGHARFFLKHLDEIRRVGVAEDFAGFIHILVFLQQQALRVFHFLAGDVFLIGHAGIFINQLAYQAAVFAEMIGNAADGKLGVSAAGKPSGKPGPQTADHSPAPGACPADPCPWPLRTRRGAECPGSDSYGLFPGNGRSHPVASRRPGSAASLPAKGKGQKVRSPDPAM